MSKLIWTEVLAYNSFQNKRKQNQVANTSRQSTAMWITEIIQISNVTIFCFEVERNILKEILAERQNSIFNIFANSS